MKLFNDIIEKICINNNIKYNLLSKNYIYKLEKDKKVRYIFGYKFDYNTQSLSKILDDKYAFYEILKSSGFSNIIEHNIIFKNYDSEYLKDLFYKYNNKVILKANTSTCGKDVLYIDDINNLYLELDNLLKTHYSVSLCPFIKLKKEIRVIVCNDEVKLIYGKKKPEVIGNGKNTLKELLVAFNKYYFQDLDDSYNHILKEGETYTYNWKFNLSQGAVITDVKNKDKYTKLAKEICQKLNIKLASIDLVETEDNELLIMEANSGIMLNNYIKQCNAYNIAYNIYEDIILKMFL